MGGRRSTLDLALLGVGLAALLLAGVEVALVAPEGGAAVLYVLTGLVYVLAGLLAWWRRPVNRVGPLIVLAGAAVLVSALQSTNVPPLVAVGSVLATLCLAVVVHLLHAFPSGRIRGPASRVVVVAVYVVCTVLQAPLYLFTPGSPLAVADRPDLAGAGSVAQTAAGSACVLATAVILAGRLRRADPRRRRILAPVFGYGVLAVLAIPLVPRLGLTEELSVTLQLLVLAGIPLAFALGVLRGGFARTGAVEELGTWLARRDGARQRLTAALAGTLGDDSLQVLFAVPHGYADAAGTLAVLPRAADGRGVVEFDVAGQRVAAIVYDATLNDDPEPVRAAGRVAALALAHERLVAELRSGEEEVRRSRVRIVEAADRERRRIARNLHDGLQVRMVLLAMDAQQLAESCGGPGEVRRAATSLRAGIDEAAGELRAVVHEVMPAALIERGLAVAIEDLVDRVPLAARLDVGVADRLPAAVETTAYFVVAEALANALKHADATRVEVRLSGHDSRLRIEVRDDGVGGATSGGGSGLDGLADRVDTLRGSLRLHSPDGAGTELVVELPCGS